MEVTTHEVVAVAERSQPVAARLAAQEAGHSAGFGADDVHRAGLVATEMATNLVKHTSGGEVLVRILSWKEPAIEIMAIDRGPGIADMAVSMADGFSTAGSPGTGLGAITRMSDACDVFSRQGQGTVVYAAIHGGRAAGSEARQPFRIGAVSVAKHGESVCGDAWSVQHRPHAAVALVADGLGHGLHASEAATAAVAAFGARTYATSAATLEAVHGAIRHTRGAAGAIVELDCQTHLARFTGVGNIAGAVCRNGTVRQMVSHNGTLGHEARYFREYSYPWEPGAIAILHSDGLSSHWSLDPYPGLKARHPAVIAAVLYRDFSRQRDDVTVLVLKESA
jgi:anti-sigma regulatory factor (Ser/Thr protein kinase)